MFHVYYPQYLGLWLCAKSSWCEDYLHAITFGPNDSLGSIMDVQKCAKMNLGRVTRVAVFLNLPWLFLKVGRIFQECNLFYWSLDLEVDRGSFMFPSSRTNSACIVEQQTQGINRQQQLKTKKIKIISIYAWWMSPLCDPTPTYLAEVFVFLLRKYIR